MVKEVGFQTQFVMEATGVYHLNLIFFLQEKKLPFSVVNALQIKRYIQMHLERNKSDKKDAKRIEKSFQKIIKKLQEEKAILEKELQEKLQEWDSETLEIVSSVKGIGKRAAAELLIYTHGFKDMKSYKQLISYAGLSPTEYSSGSSIRARVRICKQGGRQLRNILYTCALNAKKTNAQCRALFDRLVANGKNKNQPSLRCAISFSNSYLVLSKTERCTKIIIFKILLKKLVFLHSSC